MLQENRRLLNIFIFISFGILLLSSAIGSLCFMFDKSSHNEIYDYLNSYKSSICEGMDIRGIIKTSCIDYLIIVITIVISSFFKYGYIISLFCIGRVGFTNGFTISAIINTFKVKSLPMLLTYTPEALIVAPVLIFFLSISAVTGISRVEKDVKRKIIYIIFSIIILSIFCIASVFEGFLTTTFVNWLLNKVT